MKNYEKFLIDGQWVAPLKGGLRFGIVNPATGSEVGSILLGDGDDVARAIGAARRAFSGWSTTDLATRVALVEVITAAYEKRLPEIADAICEEMGAPHKQLALPIQAPVGLWHLRTALACAREYQFAYQRGTTQIVKEPVGVCALITPWNWPMSQAMCKIAPALLAGCTVVFKPSEYAALSAQILAEIIHAAGLPPGVFNMIHGDGALVGPLLSEDPQVDMVSLTGSTQAGASVMRHAAATIKTVSLELGGKSANIILDNAPFEQAVAHGVISMMNNSGQTCNSPARLLVPLARLAEAERIAVEALSTQVVGDPHDPATTIGPLANERQYERVQSYIAQGVEEGARLIAGGLGHPAGFNCGSFARPTIFSNVDNSMAIAQEEIFGPVLVIIPYADEDHAVAIANDSVFGLSGFVWGATKNDALRVARRMRTGMVHLNGAIVDLQAPFGGYKQSGIGREWGAAGIDEFVEVKAVMGCPAE